MEGLCQQMDGVISGVRAVFQSTNRLHAQASLRGKSTLRNSRLPTQCGQLRNWYAVHSPDVRQ